MGDEVVVARSEDRARESWEAFGAGNASWFTLFSGGATPTSGMSAGVMEIAANGGVLRAHRHRQAEVYFVASGAGVLTVEGVATAVSAGSAAFIPGDAEHGLLNEGEVVLVVFYVFAVDRFGEVEYRFG